MRQKTTNRIALGVVAAVVLLVAGVLLSLHWLDPKSTVSSHSIANARDVRISQLHDQWDPLVQYSVEIVYTLKSNYGKLVDSPDRMCLAVLVYVSTYFSIVNRSGLNNMMIEYPEYYRVGGPLVASNFYWLNKMDRKYLRPHYWKPAR